MRTVTAIALAAFLAATVTDIRDAAAQDASAWDSQLHAATRLLAGGPAKNDSDHTLRAGIEIRLEPGWKTYWRDPGDSGVPPSLSFEGSTNVKTVSVLWPAPEKFDDGAGGNSIGYANHIILPLHIAALDASKPVALQVKLSYAVCGKLCVPVESDLALTLSGDGAEEATIEKAESRVPRRVALGPRSGLAVLSVRRGAATPHDRVIVEVEAPAGAPVEIFVEGPGPDWSLPLPTLAASDGDKRRFEFDLDGLPPNTDSKGAILTFTAVSGDNAIEVPARLD
jgi:DsbC/DsbD-like thiol-disulfide interchange protein